MPLPKSATTNWDANDFRWGSENEIEDATVVLASGQVLVAGMVLGRVDATGQYVLCAKLDGANNAIADGSQKARVVLADDVDTTAGIRKGMVYTKGTFVTSFFKYGKGHTRLTTMDDLRDVGLYSRLPATVSV